MELAEAVPIVGLWFWIVAFPCHTHLFFIYYAPKVGFGEYSKGTPSVSPSEPKTCPDVICYIN